MAGSQCGCCTAEDPSPGTAGPVCYCPVDDLLDVVGKEYALAILSLLTNDGSKRHSEIAETLDVSSSSTLTDRLQELADAGLIERTSHDQVPPHVEYSLTPAGREFVRRLRPLLEWVIRTTSDPAH